MYVRISKLLSDQQVKSINKVMDTATFIDGRSTGGVAVQAIKNNLQLDRDASDFPTELDTQVLSALWNHPTLRSAVIPTQIMAPYYSKYLVGMEYGTHVDNPVMGTPPAIRTDVSITIFLNDPKAYDGGELIVKSEVGDASFKLPAGDAIIYPTGALHAVNKIAKGERRVVVSWMQSMIADPYRRRMVYELDMVCQSLFHKMPDTEEQRVLMRTYGNLVRIWGQP
ncbi:MAG: Fe2+-dependent dioxygenase [Rhodospirillales bacterium]|nr:Fe2+-dependent dioxygenase [Rhodospirillales bacterium]